jgi:two-component system sensor histidine kinase ComP
LILIIASVFIDEYITNVQELVQSEERHRHLIEWLPESVIVSRQGKIAYVNPAGTRLLGAGIGDILPGRMITDMIDPEFKELFRNRVAQAELGARIDMDKVRILPLNGTPVIVGMSLGAMLWDKEAAVQIVIRNP